MAQTKTKQDFLEVYRIVKQMGWGWVKTPSELSDLSSLVHCGVPARRLQFGSATVVLLSYPVRNMIAVRAVDDPNKSSALNITSAV